MKLNRNSDKNKENLITIQKQDTKINELKTELNKCYVNLNKNLCINTTLIEKNKELEEESIELNRKINLISDDYRFLENRTYKNDINYVSLKDVNNDIKKSEKCLCFNKKCIII